MNSSRTAGIPHTPLTRLFARCRSILALSADDINDRDRLLAFVGDSQLDRTTRINAFARLLETAHEEFLQRYIEGDFEKFVARNVALRGSFMRQLFRSRHDWTREYALSLVREGRPGWSEAVTEMAGSYRVRGETLEWAIAFLREALGVCPEKDRWHIEMQLMRHEKRLKQPSRR